MEHNSNGTDNHSQLVHGDVGIGLDYLLFFRLVVWGYLGMILSIFGIVGNIITIVVLTSPSMRTTSTNVYLTALSCSNILFLLIFIPSYSMRYLLGYSIYMSNQPHFPFEILLMRLPTTPVYNTILLSIIYLTIGLSADRLVLVKFPLKAKRILTKGTTLAAIGCIYLFSIVYCIPYWLEQKYDPVMKQCNLTEIGVHIYKYTRIYTYIPIVYVIPFITLTCINISIIQTLIAKKRHKASLTGKSTKRRNADHHITLMLVAVIIVFVLSQFPLLVLNVWVAYQPAAPGNSLTFQVLQTIGNLLIALNTSTNFLLYCCFGQKFRQTLIELVFNLCSGRAKQTLPPAASLPRNQLSVETRTQRTSCASSTVTNDSKLVRAKPPEPEPAPVRKSDEESRPLLPPAATPVAPTVSVAMLERHTSVHIDDKHLLILKI